MNSHQTAKAAVAKMAVMPIEINSESAASLIQSLTVAAPHRLHCRVPIVSLFFLWGYVAFFTGA
jgi:hypothetical protein